MRGRRPVSCVRPPRTTERGFGSVACGFHFLHWWVSMSAWPEFKCLQGSRGTETLESIMFPPISSHFGIIHNIIWHECNMWNFTVFFWINSCILTTIKRTAPSHTLQSSPMKSKDNEWCFHQSALSFAFCVTHRSPSSGSLSFLKNQDDKRSECNVHFTQLDREVLRTTQLCGLKNIMNMEQVLCKNVVLDFSTNSNHWFSLTGSTLAAFLNLKKDLVWNMKAYM